VIRRLCDRLRSDEGFTLIEIIVVCFLGVLVVGIVGGIYITSISVQQLVGSMNQGTTDGQVAARDIDSGVRNASEFGVTTLPSGDQLLVVRSLDASDDADWYCRAWYYSAADGGSIRRHSVLDDPDEDDDIVVPTAAQLAGWTLLVEGVRPTETIVFAEDPDFTMVLVTDFTTTDTDDADGARIRFSTPLMPGAMPAPSASEESTCL
jgi:type II secretory pathway pseudopilin PulG